MTSTKHFKCVVQKCAYVYIALASSYAYVLGVEQLVNIVLEFLENW